MAGRTSTNMRTFAQMRERVLDQPAAETFVADVARHKRTAPTLARSLTASLRLDILVNNAAEQHPQDELEDITADPLERTFRTKCSLCSFSPRPRCLTCQRGNDRQHHFCDGVPRQSSPPRLLGHQGSDRGLHSLTLEGGCRARDSRECRSAGPHLYCVDPLDLPARQGRKLWR